jgi:hypothetical protein
MSRPRVHAFRCRSALARERGSPFSTATPEEMHSPASRFLRMCAARRFNIHGAKCRSALARERGSPFNTPTPENMHSPASRLLRMCAVRRFSIHRATCRSALAREREVHSTHQRLKRCIRQQAGSYGCVQPAGLTFTGARRRGALAHERGSALSGVHRQLLLNEIQKALNPQRQL